MTVIIILKEGVLKCVFVRQDDLNRRRCGLEMVREELSMLSYPRMAYVLKLLTRLFSNHQN